MEADVLRSSPRASNKNGAGGINGMAKLLALHERESAPLINLSIVKKIVSKRDLNDLTFFLQAHT